MSSLIPKISIGRDTKRNHFDLSCMTHTTSEIGYVQPTFGRTIVPKSKVRIATRTGSRLSPLYVPTMGKIDIRHYHTFVPYTTIWTPFDSFLTKQNYTLPSGETYVPTSIPHFAFGVLFNNLVRDDIEFTSGYDPKDDLTGGILNAYKNELCTDAELGTLRSNELFHDVVDGAVFPKHIISKEGHLWLLIKDNNKWTINPMYGQGEDFPSATELKTKLAFPSAINFDFSDELSDFSGDLEFRLVYNFNGALKRLRTIFMGLGYSFNPFDGTAVTALKLLSFYKSYYTLFGVNRERNFFNTYCYKCIKYMSENIVTDIIDFTNHPLLSALFINFVRLELSNCTYTCPVDYFSASDICTGRGGAEGLALDSPMVGIRNGSEFNKQVGAINVGTAGVATSHNTGLAPDYALPLGQQIAMRLMRFVNKNSVIGRKISDILRARYGVTDMHNQTHESVIRVGASSTDIEIAAIYSNTETEDIPLGGYAGAGVSSRSNANSKTFTFESDEFGTLITLTAVVPKMGYFQGMLRENSDGVTDFSEFWTPEFDALGWQAVRYNELVADKMVYSENGTDVVGTSLGTWGYIPRMTHLKVSFNRCLGDISIPHMQDSMLPYTLDRFFENRKVDENGVVVATPLPVNEAQSFRSGTQGQTNRIFADMSPTEDHVIMQIFFDIKMVAPMKSISTSFDTWDEESEQSVEVAHE